MAVYAKYRRLAAEQAALRRLATLVARGVEPGQVLARWPRRCADACLRTPPDCGASNRIARLPWWPPLSDPEALTKWPVGTRTPVEGDTIATLVQRTGRPARIEQLADVAGPIAARVRAVGVTAAVAVPMTLMDACGAWRRSVPGSPALCQPTPSATSAASPN